MLELLKKSDLAKKVILSIYIFITFLILLRTISPQPTKGSFLIILSFIFISLSILIFLLNLKDWLKLNVSYLKLNIKLMLYFFGCLVIGLTTVIDYLDAFKNILTLSSIFIFGIFTFMSLSKNKEDIVLSFNLLKIFSGVFVLMSIMIYTTYKDAISLENDYYKTKITYMDKIEKEKTIKDYESFIESTLKLYTPEEININSKDESIKKEKRKFHLFTNIASTIIIITIIMCTIFLITTSSVFKVNRKKKISYRIRRYEN